VTFTPFPIERYPTLLRRYLSSLADGFLVFALLVVIGLLPLGEGDIQGRLRLSLFVFLLVWYEPVLTSHWCTFGQWLTGIRVRSDKDESAQVGVLRLLLRTVMKGLLGWISFFSMPFTDKRRALHDLAAGTVVVHKRD